MLNFMFSVQNDTVCVPQCSQALCLYAASIFYKGIYNTLFISGYIMRLKTVLEVAQRHIHSSSQLFKLAQDVFKIATPPDTQKHLPLLNAAFELGLQV